MATHENNFTGSYTDREETNKNKHTVDLSSMPSNSNKSRQEPQKKEIVPVVGAGVAKRKTNMGKKFADTFFSESVKDVKKYVIEDVLMPSIKDTFLDIIFQGLSMLLTGDPGRGRGKSRLTSQSSGYKPPKASYTSYYDEPEKTRRSYASRNTYSLEDLIVESKGDAERILDGMIDILGSYKVVTVGDLYMLAGLSTEPSDFNYGWTNLENASSKRVNGGYLIDLPRARDIRNI